MPFGHIKRNTRGTSNEISFSVLDAKNAAHADAEKDDESPLGRISLFTLGPKRPSGTPSKDPSLPEKYTQRAHSAPSRPSWEFSGAEVKDRKLHRKRHRRMLMALMIVAVLVLVGFGATFGITQYQQSQERAHSLSAQIEEINTQFTAAQPFLSLVDTTLATPLPDLDSDRITQALDDFDQRQQSISTKLRAAKTAIEDIERTSSGSQSEKANDALSAINALMKSFEVGRSVLEEVVSAAKVYDQAEAFLASTMEGDSLARQAAAIDLVDAAAAQEAISVSDSAIAQFAQARDAVRAVENTGSWLIDDSGLFDQSAIEVLKPFEEYATLRITAQGYAKQTDEARANLSSQEMIEANTNYNSTEEEAARLIADKREEYPTDIVRKAYEATLQRSEDVALWQSEYAKANTLLNQISS